MRRNYPRKALRGGIQKSNVQEILSSFGNKYPQNGSKNGAERGWDNPTKGLLWIHQPRGPCVCDQPLYINVQRFRGGLVFKAHRLCVSLNSRLESDKEEEGALGGVRAPARFALRVEG